MTNKEMAALLREFAGELEAIETELGIKAKLIAYRVNELERLQALSRFMADPMANSHKGTHWLVGYFRNCTELEVSAFYRPGLLGTTKKKRTVVVDTEQTDLSLLTGASE